MIWRRTSGRLCSKVCRDSASTRIAGRWKAGSGRLSRAGCGATFDGDPGGVEHRWLPISPQACSMGIPARRPSSSRCRSTSYLCPRHPVCQATVGARRQDCHHAVHRAQKCGGDCAGHRRRAGLCAGLPAPSRPGAPRFPPRGRYRFTLKKLYVKMEKFSEIMKHSAFLASLYYIEGLEFSELTRSHVSACVDARTNRSHSQHARACSDIGLSGCHPSFVRAGDELLLRQFSPCVEIGAVAARCVCAVCGDPRWHRWPIGIPFAGADVNGVLFAAGILIWPGQMERRS